MTRSLLALGLAAGLVACADLEHTNPHDPETPPDRQARATLAGEIALEATTEAPSLAGIRVSIPGTSLGADTDAEGRYAIAGVPPGTYAIQALATGYSTGTLTGIPVTLDDGGRTVTLPTMTLVRARGAVTGSVSAQAFVGLDGGPAPLSGAMVSLSGLPGAVTTDAAGGFLLSGVPTGSYNLEATRLGFEKATVGAVMVTPSAVQDVGSVAMTWDPGGVNGTVLVQGAATSGGVTVRVKGLTLVGTSFQATTTSAPDGSYGLEGLVPAGDYNVTFELAEHGVVATATSVAPHATTTLPGVVLVRDTGDVTGVATLQGSGDHSGIQVALSPQATNTIVAAALTDPSGLWRVNSLPVGIYDVAYTKTGYLAQAGQVSVLSRTAVTAPPASLPAIPGALRGRCLLEGVAGGALAGTTVRIVGSTISTATLADGGWVLSGVGAGAQVVAFERSGFEPQQVQVVSAPGGDLTLFDVTLAVSRGALAGSFTLQGAAASAGVVVTASGPAWASTLTGADGAFALTGLPVGTYSVTARHDPDFDPVTVTGLVVSSGATTAVPGSPRTLPLSTSGALSGAVTVERGAPAGVAVALAGLDRNGAAVTRSTATDGAGAYAFSGLPNGTYRLSFSKSGYADEALSGLPVTGGPATAPAVQLRVALGTIAGLATLSAGPVAGFSVGPDHSGIVVTLTGADVPVPAAVTDSAGRYRFDGVPVSLTGAEYTLTATKPWFTAQQTTVAALAAATSGAEAMALPVAAGALSGTAVATNVLGGGDGLSSGGISVGITGTAFNGTAWSAAAVTAASGSWTSPALPPGTYQLIATASGRDCTSYSDAVVGSGAATSAGSVLCLDAIAPTALALGAPSVPPGAQAGYTNLSSVSVPVTTHATDATSPTNLRGYQLAVGVSPDWSVATLVLGTPASLTYTGLTANAELTLWARAVDTAGNAGTATAVRMVTDAIAPATPTISTPRSWVNATTASATIQGSEGDLNFAGYETCQYAQAATSSCPSSPAAGSCAWTASGSAVVISLTSNQRTCLWARGYDRAGNRSGVASVGVTGITSDLTAPSPPVLAPAFDPTLVTIRAPWVDFFVAAAATDSPGSGLPWAGIAYLDLDTGSGFTALCGQEACRPGGTWSPCGCGCIDQRLLCDGTTLVGVRVPLQQGTRNSVAVRAVDLAGNAGAGVGQQIEADAVGDVIAGTVDNEYRPAVRGRLVTWIGNVLGGSAYGWILDLGAERRFDAFDARCQLPGGYYTSSVQPASDTLVVSGHTWSGARMTRAGADGRFCTGDDTNAILYSPPSGWAVDFVSGFGERAAWTARDVSAGSTATLFVSEPGADGLVGTADDVRTSWGANYLGDVTVGERSLLYRFASCGASCYTWIWRIRQPSSSGSWSTGTYFDLPATTASAGLSFDGRRVAWREDDGSLRIRDAGPDVRFGTGDDVVATATRPAGVSFGSVAVDGSHVVSVSSKSGLSWVFDWSPGADDVFGTSDDVTSLRLPTSGYREYPGISDGYFVTSDQSDILGFDLSVLRWETASEASELATDGRGHLLMKRSTLDSRAPSGAERNGPSASLFSVNGSDLVTLESSNAIRYRQPAPDGGWFGAGAPASVLLRQQAGYTTAALDVGGGKVVVREHTGTSWSGRVIVLEPNGQPLSAFGTYGTAVNLFPAVAQYTSGKVAASARQVLFSCGEQPALDFPICVHNAGADGRFGTADDPIPTSFASYPKLVHPKGSPRHNQLIYYPQVLRIRGNRLLVAEFGQGIFLFDAGADGLFNTSDDTGRKLGPFGYAADLAGDWTVWFDDGAPAGVQVWMARGMSGAPAPVTAHYSTKAAPAVEPSGRVFWVDRVFNPEAVFVRSQ